MWSGIMAPVASSAPNPRYLCLALPYLSTDRIHRQRLGRDWRSGARREQTAGREAREEGGTRISASRSGGPDKPLAVVAKIKSALRLIALDATAERAGLSVGQALADARAMIPSLDAVDEDGTGDERLLTAIADWAERYTPLVALAPPHGLMLDITGAAHLFGGEEGLRTDLAARLQAQGFLARAAIADTP